VVALKKPVGAITRGTTNPNRLRRIDRYLTQLTSLRQISNPLAVDLGYGRTPVTALELLARLEKTAPGVRVLGIEIDPERVKEARVLEHNRLAFAHGGFEIPIPTVFSDRVDVDLIRALNVLRQYQESEVASAWSLMQSRLSESGIIVEGTSDEIGRVASWITLDKHRPISFTVSLRLPGLDKPSKVAERLPKILIHKNTPGNKIHSYLAELDSAWDKAAGFAAFGSAQRFVQTAKNLVQAGWPIDVAPKRWRLGELTVNYEAISP
jgi:D-serine deaminase-like pyridoxal phosphate-dependent protein